MTHYQSHHSATERHTSNNIALSSHEEQLRRHLLSQPTTFFMNQKIPGIADFPLRHIAVYTDFGSARYKVTGRRKSPFEPVIISDLDGNKLFAVKRLSILNRANKRVIQFVDSGVTVATVEKVVKGSSGNERAHIWKGHDIGAEPWFVCRGNIRVHQYEVIDVERRIVVAKKRSTGPIKRYQESGGRHFIEIWDGQVAPFMLAVCFAVDDVFRRKARNDFDDWDVWDSSLGQTAQLYRQCRGRPRDR